MNLNFLFDISEIVNCFQSTAVFNIQASQDGQFYAEQAPLPSFPGFHMEYHPQERGIHAH